MKAKRGQRFALGLVVAITAGFWLIYLAVDAMYWGSRDDWKGGVPTLVTHTLDADLSIFDIVGTRVVDTFSDSDITPFSPAAVPSSGATATQDLTWWLPITGGTRPSQVGPSSTSIFAPLATRTATGILPSPVTHVVTSTSGVSPSSTAMPPSVGPTSTATRPAPTATVYVPPTATTAPPPTSTTEPPPPPPTDTPDQPTRTPEPPPTEPPPTEPPPATGEPTQEGGVPAQAQYLRDDGSLLLEGRLLAQLAEMVDQWLAGIWSTASLD